MPEGVDSGAVPQEASIANNVSAEVSPTPSSEKVSPKVDYLDKAKLFDDLNIPLKATAYRKLADQYDFLSETFKDQWLVFSTLGPVEGFDDHDAAIELLDSLQSNFSVSNIMEVDGKFSIFSPSGETKTFNSRQEAQNYLSGLRPADTNLIIEQIGAEPAASQSLLTTDPREIEIDPVEIPEGTPPVSDTDMAEFLAMMDAINPRNNPS